MPKRRKGAMHRKKTRYAIRKHEIRTEAVWVDIRIRKRSVWLWFRFFRSASPASRLRYGPSHEFVFTLGHHCTDNLVGSLAHALGYEVDFASYTKPVGVRHRSPWVRPGVRGLRLRSVNPFPGRGPNGLYSTMAIPTAVGRQILDALADWAGWDLET